MIVDVVDVDAKSAAAAKESLGIDVRIVEPSDLSIFQVEADVL